MNVILYNFLIFDNGILDYNKMCKKIYCISLICSARLVRALASSKMNARKYSTSKEIQYIVAISYYIMSNQIENIFDITKMISLLDLVHTLHEK